jgi:hypothetical protein
MNDRYIKLLNIQIESFVNIYNTSTAIFENLGNKNKLLHSGEYGVYRENAVKKMLEFALPIKYGVSSGFIINSHNETSTQCDIVVHEINETPLIEADEMTRFFPVESVSSIGEIKSDLTQKQLVEAVIKLSKNKSLFKVGEDYLKYDKKFDKELPQNTMYSFLICNEIKALNHKKLFSDLDEAYIDNNISDHHRHNIIVSIKNGVLTYEIPDDRFEPLALKGQKMNSSCQNKLLLNNAYIEGDHLKTLKYFVCSISGFMKARNNFYADPVGYIY